MFRYTRLLLVSVAAFATMGIAAASADAPSITGYPNQIAKVNLNGYVIQTSYSLGANTGFTFQQTYGAKTVTAHAVPDDGQRFNSNYTAMPVGKFKRALLPVPSTSATIPSGWYPARVVTAPVETLSLRTT